MCVHFLSGQISRQRTFAFLTFTPKLAVTSRNVTTNNIRAMHLNVQCLYKKLTVRESFLNEHQVPEVLCIVKQYLFLSAKSFTATVSTRIYYFRIWNMS